MTPPLPTIRRVETAFSDGAAMLRAWLKSNFCRTQGYLSV